MQKNQRIEWASGRGDQITRVSLLMLGERDDTPANLAVYDTLYSLQSGLSDTQSALIR